MTNENENSNSILDDGSIEDSSTILTFQGVDVLQRPQLQRTASEEGYFPPDIERTESNQIVGGDDIARYALKDDSGSFDPSEHYNNDEEYRPSIPASRRSSISQRIKEKFGIWDKEIRGIRMEVIYLFLKVYMMMCCFMLSVFSIYWGTYYDRTSRFKNLNMLVVNADQEVGGVVPYFGQSVLAILSAPAMEFAGTWEIVNYTEFESTATSHGRSVEDGIKRLERDLTAMGTYVIPFISQYQSAWLSSLTRSFYPNLLSQLSDNQKTDIVINAPELLTRLPNWLLMDMRPSPSTVIPAPYQVGSIYLIIITFFQFNFFAAVHQKVSKVLKAKHFILYRMISSQISYLVLSLGYCCVSAAFQMHFDIAYKGGFGVYWMVSFLTMSAVGGANENVATVCFATYPPVVGFWILSWVIINISPTFSPMALTSVFYRYGYLFPIHNSVEAYKVIFFNTYKGQIGRNIGILVAWIALNNLLMPVTMKFFAYRMRKKAMAEAKQETKESK